MTITEPLPATGYGKADWTDYSNYWREADAEWMMERSILRYQTTAARNTEYPTPKFGHITYNEQAINLGGGLYADRPEMWSKQHNAWVPLLMLANIMGTKDDSTGVGLAHKSAGGKGVIFEPTRTVLDNPIYVMGGVLSVDATGVTVKTGAKTVKLTTDATSLVSDSPISATALSTAGALTAVSATLSGALTVASITLSGTLAGGVLNGSSGTVGGVAMGTTGAHGSGGVRANAQGFHAQQGAFYGDATGAVVRQRAESGGAYGTAFLQVASDRTNVAGDMYINTGYLRIMGGRGVPWHNAAGTHTAWISPTIYSGSDPGAANYPDGTIWIS